MKRASAALLTLPRRATSRKPSTWTSWSELTLPLRDSSMATALATNSIYGAEDVVAESGESERSFSRHECLVRISHAQLHVRRRVKRPAVRARGAQRQGRREGRVRSHHRDGPLLSDTWDRS